MLVRAATGALVRWPGHSERRGYVSPAMSSRGRHACQAARRHHMDSSAGAAALAGEPAVDVCLPIQHALADFETDRADTEDRQRSSFRTGARHFSAVSCFVCSASLICPPAPGSAAMSTVPISELLLATVRRAG